VIDFLELPHWPIFNVADMCITAAAILIMFLSVVKGISITGQRHARPARGDSGDDDDHNRSTVARG
jgi:signal peptidase II